MIRSLPISAFAIILLAVFLPGATARAATFSIEMPRESIRPGDTLTANVFLDTGGEHVNAYEGTLSFPEEFLSVKSVRDGGSIITVWLERPASRAGGIHFSGITPGGYAGERGLIFSVVFLVKKEGGGAITLKEGRALLNTGDGAEAFVTSVPSRFSIAESAPTGMSEEEKDTTRPENFTPIFVEGVEVFEGKKFIVFATQDKGVGMDRYEVCEGIIGACAVAESPHLLARQKADVLIRVKAVDGAGNERTEFLFTDSARIRYAGWILLTILMGAALGVYIRRRA